MSDFYQTGVVATLHRLGDHKVEILEQQLERFVQEQPVALVLPALYAEFEKPAMEEILQQLSQVRYVRQFVVSFAILFAGIVAAVAIAFGLGAQDLARDWLHAKIHPRVSEDEEVFRHL